MSSIVLSLFALLLTSSHSHGDSTEGSCRRLAVDIVIGLDQSDSLAQFGSPSTAWQRSLDFAISIVNSFVVSPDLARISVAKINYNITVAFDLDAYNKSGDVVTAIRKLTMDGGSPILPVEQLRILWQIFVSERGARPNVQKIFVGSMSRSIVRAVQNRITLLSELADLKNANISLNFIVVKHNKDESDWLAERHGSLLGLFVRFVPSYEQMQAVIPEILNNSCRHFTHLSTTAASSPHFDGNKTSSELFVAMSSLVGLMVVAIASVVGCFLYARFRRPHKSTETRQDVVSVYDVIVESDMDVAYDDISGPYIGLDKTTRESDPGRTGYERVGRTQDNQEDITVVSSEHDCPFSSGNAEELPDNSNYIKILPEEDEM